MIMETFHDQPFATSCMSGKNEASNVIVHYNQYLFPSIYARKSLLYVQLLSSATFDKHHFTQRKNLSSYLLLQAFTGKGGVRYEGNEYMLEKDDVCLIDCRKEHEYFSSDEHGWGYRLAHFDGNIMQDYYMQILSHYNVKFHFDEDSKFQALFQELFKELIVKGPTTEIIVNRILTDMITEIPFGNTS